MNFYAGIGSRKTPASILELMTRIGRSMPPAILRSGAAYGADSAFEDGCDDVNGTKEIFKAEDATPEAIALASKFHPAWEKCNDYARQLHGRNAMILLGRNLDQPVGLVLCWTEGAMDVGGTGLGIRIARKYGIPVENLWDWDVEIKLRRLVNA